MANKNNKNVDTENGPEQEFYSLVKALYWHKYVFIIIADSFISDHVDSKFGGF